MIGGENSGGKIPLSGSAWRRQPPAVDSRGSGRSNFRLPGGGRNSATQGHLKLVEGSPGPKKFVTLEKSNSAAAIQGVNELDRTAPRNEGIVSDHLVGTSNGVMLRRIVYVNPEDGVSYTYLTNDNTLPACQIVLLYKHRWDIEKIFHQFKSKMGERKSWASSLEAKQSHAIFECIAHNLLLLFEKHIAQSEGLVAKRWIHVIMGRPVPRSRRSDSIDAAPTRGEPRFSAARNRSTGSGWRMR
jgi:hypothetical protein